MSRVSLDDDDVDLDHLIVKAQYGEATTVCSGVTDAPVLVCLPVPLYEEIMATLNHEFGPGSSIVKQVLDAVGR